MSSIENALRIMALLGKDRPVLRVGEVCRELGLPKSSVSRLLRVLSEYGMLEREQRDFGYQTGRRVLALSDLYLARHSLLDLIDVAMDNLVVDFGFVGYAAVLNERDIVILRLKYGTYPLRLVQEAGKRLPAFSTAIGRALLARRANAEILDLVPSKTTAERKAIIDEIENIRRLGVATTVSAVIPGIAATGAAVEDPTTGEALGLSLSYPISATDEQTRTRIATRVRKEASSIGVRLGDPHWVGKRFPAIATAFVDQGRDKARSPKAATLQA